MRSTIHFAKKLALLKINDLYPNPVRYGSADNASPIRGGISLGLLATLIPIFFNLLTVWRSRLMAGIEPDK